MQKTNNENYINLQFILLNFFGLYQIPKIVRTNLP